MLFVGVRFALHQPDTGAPTPAATTNLFANAGLEQVVGDVHVGTGLGVRLQQRLTGRKQVVQGPQAVGQQHALRFANASGCGRGHLLVELVAEEKEGDTIHDKQACCACLCEA